MCPNHCYTLLSTYSPHRTDAYGPHQWPTSTPRRRFVHSRTTSRSGARSSLQPWQTQTTLATISRSQPLLPVTSTASVYGSLRAQIPSNPLSRTEHLWIHEHSVSQCLESAPQNTLLGASPPISESGDQLPRADRVHLSRLQCGHHLSLHSYEDWVRPEVEPSCRWCGQDVESVSQLLTAGE